MQLAPRPKNADDGRQDREENDNGNDVVNALAYVGNGTAQSVAAENHGADPEDSTEDIKCEVAGIGHLGGAGNRRTKGSDDRNEASQDDGSAAVFFVEIVSTL